MGKVYSAHDPDLNREVALKVITPNTGASSSESFIREARAASALNHPNIVTVYEVIHSGPTVAIAMELVTGTSLRKYCGTAQPVGKVAIWGRQIANALAEAHARGIVHRDIKPENLMLRPDGYIKVLDFGLARQSGAGRADDELALGTLGYMSPEEIEQRPLTAATDIFSLGIVLYELASGTNPFRGESAGATTRMILGLTPPALPERVTAIPRELDRLVRSMLDKSAQQLEAIATPRARRRGIAWAAAALAVCAIGGGIAGWRALPPELQIYPLASMLGAERQPSFSADGSRVAFAFAGGKDATTHIYLKSVSSAGATPLTSGALPDFRPVFSPDGTRLAFFRRAEGRLRIMVMPSGGGTENRAGEIVDLLREYSLMTWDAEGQNLLVADRVSESRPEVALFRISAESGARTQITFPPAGTSDWMPSVSTDGRTLGFARVVEDGRGDVWAVPLAGGRPERLTHSNEVFFCWTWAANGKELLISYRRSGRAYLWRQPVHGGRATRVAGLDDQVNIRVRHGGRLQCLEISVAAVDGPAPAAHCLGGVRRGCALFGGRCADRIRLHPFGSVEYLDLRERRLGPPANDGARPRWVHGGESELVAGRPVDRLRFALPRERQQHLFAGRAGREAQAFDGTGPFRHHPRLVARFAVGIFQFRPRRRPSANLESAGSRRRACASNPQRGAGKLRISRWPFPVLHQTRPEERLLADVSGGRRRNIRARTGGGCEPVLGEFPAGALLRGAIHDAGAGPLSFPGRRSYPGDGSACATNPGASGNYDFP